jgi:phosphatidylserine synthase
MLCAVFVMWTRSPWLYTVGVSLLFISMSFDLVDGWFATRYDLHSTMAHLADRVMDKIVYSIIFPLVAVGAMWHLQFTASSRVELLHAIFILLLCVIVLIRDNFAHFMRFFAMRTGPEPEHKEFTRLRTVVAAPVGALLYAHVFYIPEGPDFPLYNWISWLGNIPLRIFFSIEIIFLVINLGSIAGYCRKYGTYALDELCDADERLRRRILSFFPNSLTIMNAMMGLLAVFFAYQGRMRDTYLFLIGATVFDKLDGAVARKLGLTEPLTQNEPVRRISFGSIMDDVADAISFCIVPAWIFYIFLADVTNPLIQKFPVGAIAVCYALLGFVRLTYFTLDRNPIPGFFKGMPTPAAALLVAAPLIMFSQALNENASEWIAFWGAFGCVNMILAAVIMNMYPLRYMHMGRFMDQHSWFTRINFLVLLVSIFTPYFGQYVLLCSIIYLFSPAYTWRLLPDADQETPDTVAADAGG